MPTLHGAEISPFVRKIRIALAEKGIEYEINPVVHFALPEGYEKMHPQKKIPVWTTDGGENIPDSSVILAYLDKVAPEPRMIPEDPTLFSRALFLEEYSDSGLAPTVAVIFLQKLVYPLVLGQPTNGEKVEKALAKLPEIFAYLNETIGDHEFLVGDTFTVADAAIGSAFANFRHTGLEIDAEQYPNLRRYADAMIQRPSIAEIFAAEVAQYGGNSPEAAARASA